MIIYFLWDTQCLEKSWPDNVRWIEVHHQTITNHGQLYDKSDVSRMWWALKLSCHFPPQRCQASLFWNQLQSGSCVHRRKPNPELCAEKFSEMETWIPLVLCHMMEDYLEYIDSFERSVSCLGRFQDNIFIFRQALVWEHKIPWWASRRWLSRVGL